MKSDEILPVADIVPVTINDEDEQDDNEESSAPPPRRHRKTVSFRDSVPQNKSGDSDGEDDVDTVPDLPSREYMDLATGSRIHRARSVRLVKTSLARRRQQNLINSSWRKRQVSWTKNQAAGLQQQAAGLMGALQGAGNGDVNFSSEQAMPSMAEGQSEDGSSRQKQEEVEPADENDEAEKEPEYQQYRIISKQKKNDKEDRMDFYTCHFLCMERFSGSEIFLSMMNRFFHWCFRAGFWKVNIMFAGLWLYIIVWFAIFIFAVNQYQPECILTLSPEGMTAFTDAIHLSWTTLSTVGYGVIAPGMPSTTENGERCMGLNMLMALEAFCGVIFGGLTGAVIFAKVARVQAFAPVQFSDPIAVVYGTGCSSDRVLGGDTSGPGGASSEAEASTRYLSSTRQLSTATDELPCPVLEFRIVNTMWNQPGGEIMDASLNLVCSRLESTEDKLSKHRHQGKSNLPKPPASSPGAARKVSVFRKSGTAVMATGNMLQQINRSIISSAVSAASSMIPGASGKGSSGGDGAEPYDSQAVAQLQDEEEEKRRERDAHMHEQVHSLLMSSQATSRRSPFAFAEPVTVDEGAGEQRISPPITFHSLPVEADSHPYFKRVWTIRHVCNEHSPLLSRRIRHKIADNNGLWPAQLNSALAVRKAINFHEIIVSISGKANASGASVYAQKVYNYVDMVVGYSFVSMLGNNVNGKLIVDIELLNDVVQQVGGGAEPIGAKDEPTFKGYTNIPLFPFVTTTSKPTTDPPLPTTKEQEHESDDSEHKTGDQSDASEHKAGDAEVQTNG